MRKNGTQTGKVMKTALAAAVMAVFMSGAALADGGLEMSTSYTGVSVKPGDTVSFSLDFDNSGSSENVSLSASELPDGFEGYFQGGGNTVNGVYVKNGENDSLASYKVTIPDNAEEGSYPLTLQASGEYNSDVLTLTVNVTNLDLGSSKLTTDYEEQQGASGTSFTFNSTIQNNTAEKQSYSLSAQAPDGWTVRFAPSGQSTQVSAVDVDGQGTQGLTVTVIPTDSVEAGEYEIPISAISASETLSATLKVTITGTYDLSVTTQSGVLSFDANANKKTAVTLSVVNNGNIALNNINLTAQAPTDWDVEFSESSIDTLEAGQTKSVVAYVTPSKSAISGDYVMTINAKSTDTSDEAQFRVTVKTQTIWGFAGIAVIVLILAGLYTVFKKYGRH